MEEQSANVELDQVSDEPQTWIDKMGSYLRWKVIGPDINNPFAPVMSDLVLQRILSESELVYELLDLRCTCDGHEVLYVRNIAKPFIRSDHPCVRLLNQRDLIEAVSRQGLDDLIATEAERIYGELKAEFERRKTIKTKSQALVERGGKTMKEIKQESDERKKLERELCKPGAFKGKDTQFRIMKK